MTKVHYKGADEDFIVFVESEEDLKKWKSDRSVPLAQVVNSFKIFVTHKYVSPFSSRTHTGILAVSERSIYDTQQVTVTVTAIRLLTNINPHRHGAQGTMDGASKATLENEFGTKSEEDAIVKILEQGDVQTVDVSNRKHRALL